MNRAICLESASRCGEVAKPTTDHFVFIPRISPARCVLIEWNMNQEGGTTGVDDAFASKWGPGIGVEIIGRDK